jgi:hypothetical protein
MALLVRLATRKLSFCADGVVVVCQSSACDDGFGERVKLVSRTTQHIPICLPHVLFTCGRMLPCRYRMRIANIVISVPNASRVSTCLGHVCVRAHVVLSFDLL